jgi:hypothetical protein
MNTLTQFLKTKPEHDRQAIKSIVNLYGYNPDFNLEHLREGFYPVKPSVIRDVENLETALLENGKTVETVKEENTYRAFLPVNVESPFYSLSSVNDTVEDSIEEKESALDHTLGKARDYGFMEGKGFIE